MPQKSLLDVLEDKFLIDDGCWRWTACTTGGYGRILFRGKTIQAHRALYELLVGPIPEGMELDHLCHTNDPSCQGGLDCLHRSCVNPSHLEPVPGRENVRRGKGPTATNARKTHCDSGHEYAPENTYETPSRPGSRYCRKCMIARTTEWRRRKRLTERGE